MKVVISQSMFFPGWVLLEQLKLADLYVFYDDAWIDITPSGFVGDSVNTSNGYGTYDYDEENYGVARSASTLALKTDHFSFDNWGEHLVFCCSSDGKIYQWRPDAGSGSPDTIATQITNSPIGCHYYSNQ